MESGQRQTYMRASRQCVSASKETICFSCQRGPGIFPAVHNCLFDQEKVVHENHSLSHAFGLITRARHLCCGDEVLV